ncbi:MAG TPA: hypothetical protein VEC93_10125 [Anaerolineae bacterium]|nr:hypothetical protein [Anaerolineae bacterium]
MGIPSIDGEAGELSLGIKNPQCIDTFGWMRIIGENSRRSQVANSKLQVDNLQAVTCHLQPVNLNQEGKAAMNEGLIITLLIINIALSGAALLGVFVALGMINRGKEE